MLLTKSFKTIIINMKQNYFQFLITYKSKFIKSFKNINIYMKQKHFEKKKKKFTKSFKNTRLYKTNSFHITINIYETKLKLLYNLII